MEKVELQLIFANNLKQRRKKMGYTQSELARLVGVSTSFITEMETGRKAPSFQTIEKLSDILATPSWTLFCEYSDKLRGNYDQSEELLKFLLKNKISDVIEDVFSKN